jgi:RimJ/RimL family protein N-acetyltransferase
VERAETGNTPIVGELEVMIAEKSARGQGLALEALRAFMWYITHNLSRILAEYDGEEEENALRKLRYLRVKIGKDNVASIKLFGKLGFGVVGSREGNYFGEVEMRLGLKGVKEMIGREAGDVREMRYGE